MVDAWLYSLTCRILIVKRLSRHKRYFGCKGKIHIAYSLRFVKVKSTRDKKGVDFSFAIKVYILMSFYCVIEVDFLQSFMIYSKRK